MTKNKRNRNYKMLIKILIPMSIILIAQKVEFSERDHPSRYKETHKLILISSVVPKKTVSECSNFSLFIGLYSANILCRDGGGNILLTKIRFLYQTGKFLTF